VYFPLFKRFQILHILLLNLLIKIAQLVFRRSFVHAAQSLLNKFRACLRSIHDSGKTMPGNSQSFHSVEISKNITVIQGKTGMLL